MFQNKKIIALVPLRGGSKSIPYKNIKDIAGKPLCYWALEAAKNSKYIDEVYVSTEDEKIRKTVESFGLGVKISPRPKELAEDASSTESVMQDFISRIGDFDLLVLIQATSPLTTSGNLDQAIEQFWKDECDSLLSGVLLKKFYWTPDGRPLNYDYMKRPRRQDFPGIINENGAFYITKKEILEKYKNRLGGKIGIYVMPEYAGIDIDEPEDWPAVEKLLIKHKYDVKL